MKRQYRYTNEKLLSVITDNKIKCKCGHSIFIPHYVNKTYCTWCYRTVYRTKQLEFKDKLMKKMAKN